MKLQTSSRFGFALVLPFLIGLLLVISCVTIESATVENLLINPVFKGAPDEVPAGWQLYGGAAAFGENLSFIPDEDQKEGWILVIEQDDPEKFHGLRTVDQPAEAGVEYNFSADVRADGGRPYMLLAFLNKSKVMIDYTRVSTTSSDWTRLEAVGVAPKDTDTVRLYLYTLKGSSGTYYYRNPKLEVIQ